MWTRISSSMSLITASRRNRTRSRPIRIRIRSIRLSSRGLTYIRDGQCQPVPVLFFDNELFLASPGQFVEFGLTSGFVDFPFGSHPAFVFDSVKSWIKSALFNVQHLAGDLTQTLNDAVTVHLSER